MKIIGLSGKLGTGKTTIARMLPGYERLSFAQILRMEVLQATDLPAELVFSTRQEDKDQVVKTPVQLYGTVAKEPFLPLRTVLQLWGTEYRRAENPDYWVERMRDTITSAPETARFVIDDVRYPNEARFIRDLGGLLVRVHPYPGYKVKNHHISETALDLYKFSYRVYPLFGEEHLRIVANAIRRRAER